jgi:Ca-activated chloride channel family protein
VDLWLTPDQQGRRFFERRDYLQAAESFDDPYWKGLSFYRANEMESAIDWFGRLDSPEAEFALGNSYARLGRFELAVATYDAALDLRPGWAEAEENRALVRALVRNRPEEKDPPMDVDPTSNPAQFITDELGERGEMVAVPTEELSDEEIAEIWMRRLQTSPAEFLQSRFAIEAASQEGEVP